MKKLKTLLEILLPPLLCVFLIKVTNMSIEYYPLSFGLVIGILNWKHHKHPPFFGILLCLILSYASFFIGYFSIPLLLGILSPFLGEDSGGILALTIGAYVIAPFLVFLSYKLIFKYKKSSNFIIIGVIVLLIVVFRTLVWYSEFGNYTFKLNELSYTLWQMIMAFAIQLLIVGNKTSRA